MSEEEIYFWLKVFCDKNQSFVYEERKISLFTVFNYILDLKRENKQLKEHIEKYERYCKTTGIEELMQNKKYKEVIDKTIEYLEQPYRDNFDYSKSQLLEILKGVE